MGRFGASVLLLTLLAVPATAIEDPAGDVGATVGGAPIDVPYVDILNATATSTGTELLLRMTLAGTWSEAPEGQLLNAIFIIDLDGQPNDNVYGAHDITVLCTRDTTNRTFGCQDTNQDPDAAHAVIAAGLNGPNVTATLRLKAPDDTVALAGASNRIENGTVTAQDFTDNALPHSNRPGAEQLLGDGPMPTEKEPRNWVGIATVAAVVAGGLLYLSRGLWKR